MAEAPAPGSWQEEKALGNADYTAGRNESALEHYTAALKATDLPLTDRATILCNRAQVFLKLNKNAEAIEDCTSSLTLVPDNVKALYRRYVHPHKRLLGHITPVHLDTLSWAGNECIGWLV